MNRTLTRLGRIIAVGLLALTAVVAFRPQPAAAFPLSAVGAAVNLGSGYARNQRDSQERVALQEKERGSNFAEAIFGRTSTNEPQTIAAWLAAQPTETR